MDSTQTPSTSPESRPLAIAVKIYGLLILVGTIFSHVFLLTIRVIWGWQFFQAGKGKLGNLGQVTQNFTEWGFHAPRLNAIMASTTETCCGLLLLVGLAGRFAGAALSVVMTVAYLTVHRENVHSIDDFVGQLPFPFLFTALVVFSFGPGWLSIDGLIKYLRKARAKGHGFGPVTRGLQAAP
jgi:putative oxidoreductase